MTRAVVLCPRRADHGHRDRLWTFARAHWARVLPDLPIIEGHDPGPGPFNRARALNRAAAKAGEWDAAVLIDGDVLADATSIRGAIDLAVATDGPVLGYQVRRHLTRDATERVLAGYRGRWDGPGMVKLELRDACSSAVVVSRRLWDAVGGFDETFDGWGWEDVAFAIACRITSGRDLVRMGGDLWHLWHARSPEARDTSPTFALNKVRADRYKIARRSWAAGRHEEARVALSGLLEEAGRSRSPLDGLSGAPGADEGRIPAILHRTVPVETTAEVEGWWDRWCDLHPRWATMTHRDPLDPAAWPETSDLWDRCGSGAQLAGLIRLEALWRWGGIYVDSDVEPYQALDPLRDLQGFACWEDARVVPDAVLGARPGHPAVAEMLARARQVIEAGGKAWASGPGVTTEVLPGRTDWLLLPPGSFFPYHYRHKDERRHWDHATENPWAFGAHHWHHSWRGR